MLVAHWLPTIHEDLSTQRLAGFELFDFKKPAMIHFAQGKIPRYEIDYTRQNKRNRDKMILYSIKNLHAENRKKASKKITFSFFRKKREMKQ